MKCGMELFIRPQPSTVLPLKHGNGQVLSYHALLGVWLLIRAVIKVNTCYHKEPLCYIELCYKEARLYQEFSEQLFSKHSMAGWPIWNGIESYDNQTNAVTRIKTRRDAHRKHFTKHAQISLPNYVLFLSDPDALP